MAEALEVVYGTLAKVGKGSQGAVRATGLLSLPVAGVEPDYFELARTGRLHMASMGVVTNAIASVTDVPTTTAAMCLANIDTAGTTYLVVTRAGFYGASGTLGIGATLLGCVTSAKIATTPSANATGVVVQACRGTSSSGKAVFKDGVTIPSGSAWVPLCSYPDVPGVGIGSGVTPVDLAGRFIVPPLWGFGLSILSPAGTSPKFNFYIEWAELELDLT